MTTDKINMDQALDHPQDLFATPDRVLSHPGLTDDQKREILVRWEQDARELSVAEEEGMSGGEQNMLQRVLDAIGRLEPNGRACNDNADATTKHGGGHC